MPATRHEVWGIVLIVLGALLLLDSLGYAEFHELVRTYWPLILVLLGLRLLITRGRSTRRRVAIEQEPPAAARSEETIFGDLWDETTASSVRHSTVFGDLDIRATSQAFTGGMLSTVFGDVRFDMRTVTLAPGQQRLKINGVFGDVDLRLPIGTEYRFEGSMLLGDVNAGGARKSGFGPKLEMESPGFRTASQRIVVQAAGLFGSITVH